MSRFQEQLDQHKIDLRRRGVEILQVNLGKFCNMTCVHCHVEAGPTKTRENMDRATAEAVVRFMDRAHPSTLDVTGGAPELNPHFRYLVTEARQRGLRIMDRSNLTVFFQPGMEEMPAFLAEQKVEIVASLPCYSRENVDKQRGGGAFETSIRALRQLNALGYGREDSGLFLHLVYNPVGPHLPPCQQKLEQDYHQRLQEDFGLVFNRLFTITNMPITRYAKYLKAGGKYEMYIDLLLNSFNLGTIENLMCVNTLSVGWDGRIYDCDFNQMLGMSLRNGRPWTIGEITPEQVAGRKIIVGDHCFGCTAGAGSSCQGALE